MKHWRGGCNLFARARQAYGGLFTDKVDAKAQSHVFAFHKVKAHQDIAYVRANGTSEILVNALANDRVDHYAKEALKLHPAANTDEWKRQNKLVEHAISTCKVIAAVMPLWPPTELVRKEDKVDRRTKAGRAKPKAKPKPSTKEKHDWQPCNGRWQCSKCLGHTLTSVLPVTRKRQACTGRPVACGADGASIYGPQLLSSPATASHTAAAKAAAVPLQKMKAASSLRNARNPPSGVSKSLSQCLLKANIL